MNGPGFDWLNTSQTNTLEPPNRQSVPMVKYGSTDGNISFDRSQPVVSSQHLFPEPTYFKNTSVDQLSMSPSRQIRGSYGDSYESIFEKARSRHDSLGHTQASAHMEMARHAAAGSVFDTDDTSIPLSLTAQELTYQESKTYMRWYSNILARTNSRTITMNDVFNFLNNFKLSKEVKEKICKMFSKILYSINIGEFFALLRVISHALSGKEPSRSLIKIQAPVPTPPSILSKKRQNDDEDHDDRDNDINESATELNGSENGSQDSNKPLDIDSFTQFLLTGERPDELRKKRKSKKLKSVKFSDQIDVHDSSFANSPSGSPRPQEQLDYSLPMDQLLNRMKSQPGPSQLSQEQEQEMDEEEKEVLKDMASQINHFQNLHSVDTASIGGVPSSLHFHDGYSNDNLLQPNMTGPAQMAHMMSPSPEPDLLQPNMTGPNQMAQYINRTNDNPSPLRPNVTGPVDMARIFAPGNGQQQSQDQQQQSSQSQSGPKVSLQAFTSQMTGNTMENTLQNAKIGQDMEALSKPLLQAPIPPVRQRSVSSPMPQTPQISITVPNDRNGLHSPQVPPPVPPRSPLGRGPPPPPPSRRRNTTASSNVPPPLPPKVPHEAPASNGGGLYSTGGNDSTANILDDLKALQEEVDRIRDMTGGF
ncbi:uncharacterized protein J8A68_002529 [[Candida] subhashii]|uniref:Protein SCD5 n=1 Tax=[Candida] subhashii TaxID=561895 RepID=A0A8J5QPE2_9ASCO|nr:uncharacterized protein J8A68_002529 [[Candida] subhashii]KAG7663968.1 hypothetical protein J8A68_002529 [[Candida] subhashii]